MDFSRKTFTWNNLLALLAHFIQIWYISFSELNLYGLKQPPQAWFERLPSKLLSLALLQK